MAEYYPLLARAVASMPNSTPQTRSAIYERARKALIGQLRTIDPPVPEEDISRESRALDEAVSRLEAEIEAATRAITPPAARAASPVTPPSAPPSPPQPAPRAEPPRRPDAIPAPPKPLGTGKASLPPPLAPEKRIVSPPPPFPARPSSLAASRAEAGTSVIAETAAPRSPPALRAPGEAPLSTAPRVRAPDKPFPAPKGFPLAAPERANPFDKKPSDAEARNGTAKVGDADDKAGESRPVDPALNETTADPLAADAAVVNDQGEVSLVPKEATGETRVSDLGQGLLRKFGRPRAGSGQGAATSARDAAGTPAIANENDEEGAAAPFDRALRPRGDGARPLAPQVAPSRAGRLRHVIVGSVVGLVVVTVAITAYVLRDRPEDFAKPRPAVTADQPESTGKIVERIGGGTSGATAPARTGQQAAAPSANPPLPVAQRAALLVQAPTSTDPQAVATYVGTAVWRLDTVPAGQGQPNTVAVRADIDIPEAKLKASFVLTKNTDDALPASHLIDIRFMPQPGSVVAGVKQIDAPQMRREDTPQGEPVAGVARAVRENFFFVALAKSDTYVARNLDLLRSRPWIDVPMLLPDSKIAKITFEKGPSGDRAFADAFAAWGK